LFHCSTGKDRTGVLSIFILKILGISDEVIMKDYLISNYFLALNVNSQLNEAKLLNNNLAYLYSIFDISIVRKEYFSEVISIINNKYNGFYAYFHNQLGLSDYEINRFRNAFLE